MRNLTNMNPILIPMAVICLLCTPSVVKYEAPHEHKPLPKAVILSEATMPELVDFYADKHGVDKTIMQKTVKCESNYNPKAVNWSDSHKLSKGSHGIAQFSQQTFEYYAKQMGEEYTDPYNPKEALDVMAYMISKGQGRHWTCFRAL